MLLILGWDRTLGFVGWGAAMAVMLSHGYWLAVILRTHAAIKVLEARADG